MRVIGIIPARYASTRFPGKPLADIHGKSMIRRVYERASEVRSFSKVIVATDDERIFDHVKNFGGEVMITNKHHQSGTDRCGEIIGLLNESFDVVVNIQGDEPFIQPEQLEKLIEVFNDATIEIATLAIKMLKIKHIADPNIVKVVFDKNHRALYFSRSAIPGSKKTAGDPEVAVVYYKHLGIYAFRTEILKEIVLLPPSALEIAESLEQLRWLENGYSISIAETENDTIGVDTPADLEKIKGL